jgi:hypothetical protein
MIKFLGTTKLHKSQVGPARACHIPAVIKVSLCKKDSLCSSESKRTSNNITYSVDFT